MKENSNQGKPCIVANARAVVSLSDGRKIICTWVSVRNYDSGNKELNEWRDTSIRGAINPECYKKNAVCELLEDVFAVDRKIPGKMTCWNCDFQKRGIDQDVINELAEMFNEIKDDDDWEEVFKPQLTIHNPDNEVVLSVFQGEIRSSKKGGEKVASNTKKKNVDQVSKKSDGRSRSGHSRRPRLELRCGDKVEDLGQISTSEAFKKSQAYADESGDQVALWQYTKSRKAWKKVSLFFPEKKPQEVTSEKAPPPESDSVSANNEDQITETEFPAKPPENAMSVFVSCGFDVSFNVGDGDGSPKKFYVIQDSLGNKIAGGYLSEGDAGLAQGCIDGLNRIIPGMISFVEFPLTGNQVQGIVNSFLRLMRVKEEQGGE